MIATSANGLSKTTTVNVDGSVDYIAKDDIVYNADGSTTETVTKENASGGAINTTPPPPAATACP